MLLTLPALSLTTILFYSHIESMGLKGLYGIFTLLFFTQWIAYIRNKLNSQTKLTSERVSFALQIIAAAYVLSGISKLQQSGLGWITEGAHYFPIQVYHDYLSAFTNSGSTIEIIAGNRISEWLLNNTLLVMIFLLASLLTELGAIVLLTGKKNAFYYSILLVLMHTGIAVLMKIILPAVIIPMMILCINPLYHLVYFANNRFTRKAISKKSPLQA